ncbi:cation transporter [Euzebya rosea]|uniref:cation transporter n=1 Tax=Euzebya rosea TaxID=2052804 RepID=UPI000D3E4212|nr:cation transporter [Euzebya rosea]
MATTDTISVPEIHCGHCKASIEGALQPMDGVTSAEVDVQSTNVTVTYDESVVTRDALVSAIEEQGYEVPR